MRRKNDHYPTHQKATEALLRLHPISGVVLEPCAASGQMADVLREPHGNTVSLVSAVYTSDIDWQFDTNWHEDATDPNSPMWGIRPDWVITNPPFSLAPQILPLALESCKIGVAFLLRLTYMEPTQDRADWLIAHADQQVLQAPLNPRPNFRAGEINPTTGKPYGTDNVTVAWFVWRKNWSWAKTGIRSPFQFITDWRD